VGSDHDFLLKIIGGVVAAPQAQGYAARRIFAMASTMRTFRADCCRRPARGERARERLDQAGIIAPRTTGPEFLEKYLKLEIDKWAEILRSNNDAD
jgi:hypothetical protein